MKLMLALVAGTASLALSTPALAVGNPADGLQAMKELNLITLGDLTNGQHVQGKAYVGGDLKGNLIVAQGGGSGGFAASDRAQLTVGGNASGNYTVEKALGEPISVRIGGNSTGQAGLNGNGNIDVGGAFNVSGYNPNSDKTFHEGVAGLKTSIDTETTQLGDDLKALSIYLKDLPETATITSISTPLSLSGGGFFVFNMSAATFQTQNANFDTLFDNLSSNTTVIINVAGDGDPGLDGNNIRQDGGANLNGNNSLVDQNVLWNFYDADTLDLKGWHGSVLAPNALLSNSSTIWGSVVSNDFAMGGEVHLGAFDGDVPLPPPPETAIPEPATWAMMLLGFGLVGSLARRRRERFVTV